MVFVVIAAVVVEMQDALVGLLCQMAQLLLRQALLLAAHDETILRRGEGRVHRQHLNPL